MHSVSRASLIFIMILRTALFLSILSISTVFATFKDGNEYVYTYTGEVKISTVKPAEYYSYSDIRADLHVKPVKGDLQIWIKNVRYLTYSGSAKGDFDDATKEVPIPNYSESLTIPFVFHRYVNESESGISTSQGDELWSIKIKQAIASLLYVHEQELNKDKSSHCHMADFTLCSVKQNGENLQIFVTKSDTFSQYIEKETRSHGYPTVRRTYDFKKVNEGFILEKVSSLSSQKAYQELEVFYIYVNQTIQFKDNNSTGLKEMNTTSLIYHDVEKTTVIHKNKKTSNNLPEENSKDIISVLKNHLENLYNDLKNLQPTKNRLLDQQDELKEMLFGMKGLNVDQLNNFYSLLSNDSNLHDLMLDTTLMTNSPKAYCFITNLIENQKLNNDESMNLLMKMSSNPIPLTECLEKGLLKISYDEQSSKNKIRHQAIITLASMIRVTPNTDKQKDIVKDFVKNLKDSKHDSERAIYVYALQNADTFESRSELINISRGLDEEYKDLSGHIKALAANCIKYEHYRDFTFQDLINGKQDFEVKATALYVLLDSIDKEPFSNIISNLLLEGENHELYQLLYAKLESISKMTSRNKAKAVNAKKILHQLTKPTTPVKTATSYVFEYADELSERGLTFEITTYGNMIEQKFITFQMRLTMKDLYLNEYSYELYFHLTNGRRETTFIEILESLNNKNAEREVILKKDGFIISIEAIDIQRLMVDIFRKKLKINTVWASQLKNIETIIPTDMGTSVVFSDQMVCLNKIDTEVYLNFDKEEFRAAFDGRQRCVNYYGLSAYNPVAKLWHGAYSVIDSNANLPFDIQFETVEDIPLNQHGTFIFKRSKTPFGFQMNSRSSVYMKGEEDKEMGKISCPKCNISSIVTNGEDHRENRVLLENYNEDIGLGYKLSVFDCEEHLTLASLKSLKYIMPSTMCGINLVIGNKENNPVTQSELTYHLEDVIGSLSDGLIRFTEKTVYFNYSLKNDDKILKSWDISYECITYHHNHSDCKISVVSKKEGVTDYIIHGNNSKTYNPEEVYSIWKIQSSDVVDGKESDDSTSMVIQHTATNKNEINSKINPEKLLEECETDIEKTFDDCTTDISTLRLNIFNISYSNLKPKHIWLWTKVSDLFRSKYADKFERIDKYNNSKNYAEIKVYHPIYRDSVDVLVKTPHEAYKYDDLLLDNIIFAYFEIKPYSSLNLIDDIMNEYCEVGSNYVAKGLDSKKEELIYGKDWVDLASKYDDETEKLEWKIEAKKNNEDSNDLVIRFKIGEDLIEVVYKEGIEIKLNNKLLKLEPNELTRVSNILDVMTLSADGRIKRVIVHTISMIINIEYMRNRIRISIPEYFISNGVCKDV